MQSSVCTVQSIREASCIFYAVIGDMVAHTKLWFYTLLRLLRKTSTNPRRKSSGGGLKQVYYVTGFPEWIAGQTPSSIEVKVLVVAMPDCNTLDGAYVAIWLIVKEGSARHNQNLNDDYSVTGQGARQVAFRKWHSD